MECYCCLRNAQDLLAGGQTPYECRFNSPFEWPIIPFGAEVTFYPLSSEDRGRVQQFGTKVLPGRFMGYALNAGASWTGDQLIVDTEDLKTMPPFEIHIQRFKLKEVDILKRDNECVSKCRTGEIF